METILLDLEGVLIDNVLDWNVDEQGLLLVRNYLKTVRHDNVIMFSNAFWKREEINKYADRVNQLIPEVSRYITVEEQMEGFKKRCRIDFFTYPLITPYNDFIEFYGDKRVSLMLIGDILFPDVKNLILIDDSFSPVCIQTENKQRIEVIQYRDDMFHRAT